MGTRLKPGFRHQSLITRIHLMCCMDIFNLLCRGRNYDFCVKVIFAAGARCDPGTNDSKADTLPTGLSKP